MRHRSLRWFGVPLFWLGAMGICAALAAKLGANGSWGGVMLYVGATGLSLGSFGLNNDTALALLLRAQETLPIAAETELQTELTRDKAETNALAASPVASFSAMGLALLLHAAAAWRLMAATGML
ncbi:MAG: hypothetical protein ACI9VR_004694 [Cognaticolwellia sp.]|jgi:hypothetical protein